MQVAWVDETRVGEVQEFPPTVTVKPLTKPVPLIVRVPPPAGNPAVGDTLVIVGGLGVTVGLFVGVPVGVCEGVLVGVFDGV